LTRSRTSRSTTAHGAWLTYSSVIDVRRTCNVMAWDRSRRSHRVRGRSAGARTTRITPGSAGGAGGSFGGSPARLIRPRLRRVTSRRPPSRSPRRTEPSSARALASWRDRVPVERHSHALVGEIPGARLLPLEGPATASSESTRTTVHVRQTPVPRPGAWSRCRATCVAVAVIAASWWMTRRSPPAVTFRSLLGEVQLFGSASSVSMRKIG
jgi:hypothetical protein